MLLGMLWFAVAWGAIFYAVFWVAGRPRGSRHDGSGTESPIDILKQRYARGELSREEFDRMRQELA
jgi:putative membrane protein